MEEAVSLLYTALMVLSSLGSVCGNILLLLVLFLNKELHTDTWGLTLSFSLSDLALGLSTIPFGAHNSLFRPDGYPSGGALCQGSGFMFLLLQLASIHALAWATVDKFTEICFALSYASICSARRTRLVLVLVWLYCLVNAALPLLGFGRYSYSKSRFLCAPSFDPSNRGFTLLFMVLGIIAPMLVMCSLYGYIVYIARKQARRGTFVCNEQHCFYVPANNYFRSSVVMVATSVCLLVCWLPYISLCFYETFSGREGPEAGSALATWLVLFTTALNPWINSMTQTRYRAALKRSVAKLRQVFRRHRKSPRPQSAGVHLEASSDSRTKTTVSPPSLAPPSGTEPGSPPGNGTPSPPSGPGDTSGTRDKEDRPPRHLCLTVETSGVGGHRDTQETKDRDGDMGSTHHRHSHRVEMNGGRGDRDPDKASPQHNPCNTLEEPGARDTEGSGDTDRGATPHHRSEEEDISTNRLDRHT